MFGFISKLLPLIKDAAPLLASSLFGPAGGIVVSLIESAFGVKGNDLLTALSNPNAAITLKQLEDAHGEALEALNNANTANARERELDYLKTTGKRDWVISLFAVVFLAGFFSFVFLTLTGMLPNNTQSHSIFDTLSNITCLIVSYYFGSCHPANK